ncbi:MAG TPA: hypothetical protein VEJ36_09055 [Nitrososphaerales archaeon]|nr:hypothetical protein [Nitrososphaerales archaeon]
MSNKLSAGAEQSTQASCGLCGRALGKGFYFVCHVCGATYCYSHAPTKCDHRKFREFARIQAVNA